MKGGRIEMNKKILRESVALGLVFLFLAVSSTAENSIGSYNPIADVNRDGTIDILDLVEVGQAYGSNLTLPTQSNHTVVYVYQLETTPSEVENARVAIIDPEHSYQAVQVNYTNSCGIVNFTLNPNSNYTAIAWSNTTYNYANFTTNEFGEASVAIQLGYPHLPPNWVTITLINRTSGALWSVEVIVAIVEELVYNLTARVFEPKDGCSIFTHNFKGVLIVGPWYPTVPVTEPGKSYSVLVGAVVFPEATSVYTPDENGTANVVTYVE